MIPSTANARWELIRLGEPAVPAICKVIEPDESEGNSPAVLMIRAYIDHWKKVPQPIDPRIIGAVLANMQHDKVRGRMNYHRELLKLAGVDEPKPPTAEETIRLFLGHFMAGDREQLERLWVNFGNDRDWLGLRAKLELPDRLAIDAAWTDDFGGMAITGPLKSKAGEEVHLVLFLSLQRGQDWRVCALQAEPAHLNRQRDQFLKNGLNVKPIIVPAGD